MLRRILPAPLALFLLTLGALLSFARPASAYPWMIRHEYTTCGLCHTDPSGGGLLTAYGRAQSAVLLSTQFGEPDENPGKFKDFLFGVIPDNEHLLMQGWVRGGYIANRTGGGAFGKDAADERFLQMRADLGAQLKFSRFRASGMVGYASGEDSAVFYSQQAWVNGGSGGHVVAREYWAAYDNEDDTLTIRAGRMNLPFGIRNVEHTLLARSLTRTDTNQNQQHGVSVSYVSDTNRGEVMAIAGNFQLGPDTYRERGYAGFFEHTFDGKYAAGLSSKVTYAGTDAFRLTPKTLNQAHGVFGRLTPVKKLVVLAEADVLVQGSKDVKTQLGGVGYVQADVEPIQGVHVLGTLEAANQGADEEKTRYRAWLSAWWFVVPHLDIRGDIIRGMQSGQDASMTYLAQLHLYL
jgi:hypothetical protein